MNRNLTWLDGLGAQPHDLGVRAFAAALGAAAELVQIKAQVATNKEKMLAALLQSVTTVSL